MTIQLVFKSKDGKKTKTKKYYNVDAIISPTLAQHMALFGMTRKSVVVNKSNLAENPVIVVR